MKLLSIVFPLLFTFGICCAQEIASFNITQDDGLPSNTVYDVFQDSRGFLWVSTENGLARYNGADFRVYENNLLRSQAMSGLLEDKAGRIWLHNFFGEIVFVQHDSLNRLESWEKYYTDGFPSLSDADSSLIISVPKGIFEYNQNANRWKQIDLLFDKNNSITNYNDHLVDRKNVTWVCYTTNEATVVSDMSGTEIYSFSNREYKLNVNVLRLIEWGSEIFLFDPVLKQLFLLTENKIQNLSSVHKQVLNSTHNIKNLGDSLLAFLGTDGVTLMDKNNKSRKLISGKSASSIVGDAEGGIWVGTLNEGLYYFPFLYSTVYSKDYQNLFTKLTNDTRHKRLLAGGYDGSIRSFSYEGKFDNAFSVQSTKAKEIQSLFVDSVLNRLIFFSDKLHVYDLNSLTLLHSIEIASVKKIERMNDDYVLATSAGLITLNANTFKQKKLLASQRIATVLYDDAQQTLWIGAQKGVFTYSPPYTEVKPWHTDTAHYSPGASAMLHYQNQVILGTNTNGVFIIENKKVVNHLTSVDGLSFGRVSSLATGNNMLWIGTAKGIIAFDFISKKLTRIDAAKGLIATEIYDLKFINSVLWISHPQGLQYFDVLPQANTRHPLLHIRQVLSDTVLLKDFDKGIKLSPSSRQLTFHFDVSNNLKAQGATQIFYRMVGLGNDQWNHTTLAQPNANYLALPSGDFQFEAYAVNEDGVRSGTILSIPITVLTPFWKKAWFLTLIFISTIVVVSLILYYRFRQINERNKLVLLQQTQAQELRIAQLTSIRAQMNPHFIFNTMALIQGKVLNGQKQEATKSIQDFSMLLRKVLDFSSKEMILILDEIEILEKYLSIEKDRFNDSLHYQIVTDDTVKNEIIRIPSLLTQPFVENALRHGLMHKEGIKKLNISFTVQNDLLDIVIDDNGIGRKASAEFNKARNKEHQSFAMEAYRKRIDLLSASWKRRIKLTITDKENALGMPLGTTVKITLPLANDIGNNG